MSSDKIVHGEAALKALSFSIQVSNRTRCNACCKPCISRVTPNCGEQPDGQVRVCNLNRLNIGLRFTQQIGATHAILTGKADPLQEDPENLRNIISLAHKYLPFVDMHTNGWLLGRTQDLKELVEAGLTNITFSIASFNQQVNTEFMGLKKLPLEAITAAVAQQLFVRCSLLLSDETINDFDGVMDYIRIAGNLGVNAIVIREIWRPSKMLGQHQDVYDWSRKYYIDLSGIIERFEQEAKNIGNDYGLSKRDPLPWGTPVYVVDGIFDDPDHGVNITFARCDEATTGRIIKSVVHKPNGHGFRNWDTNGDILY